MMAIKSRTYISFLLLFVLLWSGAKAQMVGVAYYDLDRLYDTIPALFYNDSDYTPQGSLHWDKVRYHRRIAGVAAVIDSMGLPLVALNGVETEGVVRDIVQATKGEYSFLHRTSNAFDGMDFALLYYGDRFFPDYDQVGRGFLYIEGELLIAPLRRVGPRARPVEATRQRIGILILGDKRSARWAIADLRAEREGVKLVVLGRSSGVDLDALGLVDGHQRATKAGRGNVRSRSGWYMRDRGLCDRGFVVEGGDVFARDYLIDDSGGAPRPCYKRTTYLGGLSYALPIFLYIR